MATTTKLVELFNADATVAAAATTTAFVELAYENLLGLSGDFSNKDERVGYWVGKINSGVVSKADFAATFLAAAAVQGDLLTNAEFAANTETLKAIAELDEATLTTLADVQAALETAGVVTPDTTGQTFTLTTNQDILTGTSANDTFVASVAGDTQGNLADTLQNVDSIDGGEGTDTLSATLNTNTLVTPSLQSIENVVLRVTTAGGDIDFIGSTGVESVTVANSTAATGVIDNVSATSLAVKNQNTAVTFNNQTATTLGLSFDTVGKVSDTAAVEVAVDLGATVASKATTLNITTNNSNVEVLDTTGANVATAATIAATGANEVKLTDGANIASLTVTGSGSVDVSEVDLVKVATLTAGDGGITFTTGNSTATTFTATTGAGKDTLTVDGDNVTTVSTGAGDDKVTVGTAALAAAATVDLGAGDDTLVLGATASAAGATLTGGEGTDTLSVEHATYATIAGYSAANLAKITGFETLSVTDVLANTDVVDLSKISGLTSAVVAGVANAGAASVTNIGADSSVTIKGDIDTNDGALTLSLKDATGSADSLNLTLNDQYTENNDATATVEASNAFAVTTTGIETLNVTSTGTASTKFLGAAGNKADGVENTLTLTNNNLETLTVGGDQAFSFTSAAGMTKLATINASALDTVTGTGATIDVSNAATDGSAAAITITGSADNDTITGSGNADTISGGAGNDTITGGAKADTLSGGEGNDTFVIAAATDSTLVNMDVITDFMANTYGRGTDGAADENGAVADTTKWTGDVIDLSAATPALLEVSVQSNAADAQTFVQNAATDTTFAAVNVALDSSSGKLYIDMDNNGTVDTVLHLTGVTTIDEAAFII